MNLIEHLHRQRAFSLRTFGPGTRTAGVSDHIRKELTEIADNPLDLEEWVDVVLLALDGAWRAGFDPEQIAEAIEAKQAKNERRTWPDWRTADPDKAIEHVRMTNEPEKCQRCGVNPAREPHTCIYKLELDNDSETLCNCCDQCHSDCADEV